VTNFILRIKEQETCLTLQEHDDDDDVSIIWGTAVAQWLRYCATNKRVADSIPDGVMEFFIDINPSDRTMALVSTQPLTEMSTGSIYCG
jgi:hypothetical protein